MDSGAVTTRGNVRYLPVVPSRMEFALHVRRRLIELRPSVVAVELPSSLEKSYRAAIARMPQLSVILVGPGSVYDGEERANFIPVEPCDPFVEALRTAGELGAEVVFLDPFTREESHSAVLYPSTYSAELIGMDRYVESYALHPPARTPALEKRAQAMAWKLQGADPLAQICVVVSLNMLDVLLESMETPQEEPASSGDRASKKTSELFNLHPDCLAEVTSEPPYYQQRFDELRELETGGIDRPRWQLALLREAESEYLVKTGDQIQLWQRITLAKFARNLALLDRELMPGAYDLTLAARSVVDDNYAYEVWDVANRYNAQQTEDPPLETLDLSGEEVWVHTRRLRIRRRLPRLKQRLKPAGLTARKREKFKGEWAEQTNGGSICSYPPEDVTIENYGRFLKQHAKNLVSEERSRVEPFLTSSRDGIDLRETIRNWHQGKLYVRDLGRFSADVGALVIIFDEDRKNRYGYLTTWLGEHQNESDMAFYSTEPFEHLVGPGIGRAEYGGLLMTLPPRRLYDVWSDTDYDSAETKSERLLMAALDYSMQQHVVYIAARPPRSSFRQMATRLNRKIIYIPLGQLSPTKLKKIRVVHVLDSYRRRDDAKQYMW